MLLRLTCFHCYLFRAFYSSLREGGRDFYSKRRKFLLCNTVKQTYTLVKPTSFPTSEKWVSQVKCSNVRETFAFHKSNNTNTKITTGPVSSTESLICYNSLTMPTSSVLSKFQFHNIYSSSSWWHFLSTNAQANTLIKISESISLLCLLSTCAH